MEPKALEGQLLELGLADEQVLGHARSLGGGGSASLGKALLDMGVLSEEQLFDAYARLAKLPIWDGEGEPFVPESGPLSRDFLIYNRVLPVQRGDESWLVFDDPFDDGLIDLLGRTSPESTLALHTSSDMDFLLERHLGAPEGLANGQAGTDEIGASVDTEHLKDLALEAPTIRQVNDIITQAVRLGASDVHLEPFRSRVELRIRVDGVLQKRPGPSVDDYPAVVSRIKLLAGLDIAERRQSQDGRIRTRSGGHEVDIRVSVIPVLFGEDIVLRLLDQERVVLSLPQLGLSEVLLQPLRDSLRRPHGVVLVTGPTGSGKTTTLYAALRDISDGNRKIITVEDPVEYENPGIIQIPVNDAVGLTFANALRAILRHDPDVIFIGEIRDRETADIAVQAALTGHLVLATLHTNSALGAITRLLDMGIPDFLLSSTLEAVTAQRLVRRLCESCKRGRQVDLALAERYGLAVEQTIYEADGCSRCAQIGFKGRLPLFEFKRVDAAVREAIVHDPAIAALERAAAKSSPRGLLDDGIERVRAGVTSLEEVLRVVH